MELYGRTDVNVRRIAWSPMQARVLEFDWIVPANQWLGTPWTDYPAVTYTHPELGLIFIGKAIEPERQYKPGETIRVSCADVWRKWERTTARLSCSGTTPSYDTPGTAKIRLREGMKVSDAITLIMDAHSGDIPSGVSVDLPQVTDPPNPAAPTTVNPRGEWNRFHDYAINDTVTYKGVVYIAVTAHSHLYASTEATPDQNPGFDWYFAYTPVTHDPILYVAQDKTGQKVATWLHDILDQTENGTAFVDYYLGLPSLTVFDYTLPGVVTLEVGSYSIVNPVATTPLLQNGDMKLSIQNKYKSVIVEGAGKFTRHVGVSVTPTFMFSELLPGDNLVFHYRFYFPQTNVLGLYLDQFNQLADAIFYRFSITSHPNGAETTIDTGQIQLAVLLTDGDPLLSDDSRNPNYGKFYAPFDFYTIPNDTGGPAFAINEWRYTSYDGPLTVTKESSDPGLADAGDFPVQMPLYYKYDSPGFLSVQRPSGSDILVLYGDATFYVESGDVVTQFEARAHRDQSFRMAMIANAYYKRYCDKPDDSGTLQIIVKGNTANITLGTQIANFNNARVQAIEVLPSIQAMRLTVSSQPIRSYAYRFRDYVTQRSALYGNARNNKQIYADKPLFPDVTLNDLCSIVDPPVLPIVFGVS